MNDYLECEYLLSGPQQALLRVDGKEYTGTPSFDPPSIKKLSEILPQPLEYGKLLFQLAFPKNDDLYAGLKAALAIARHDEKRLRFRLNVSSVAHSDVNAIEWEALYDVAERLGLSRSREVSFSRYLNLSVQTSSSQLTDTARILAVIAAPNDLETYGLAPIDYIQTQDQIETAITPLNPRVRVDFLPIATRTAIRQALITNKYNILHIHAHGFLRADQAALVLTNDTGSSEFTDDQMLAEILEGIPLRLVVLMACRGAVQLTGDQYRGLGASLVRRGIPAVVAMRSAITVSAATTFVRDFYSSLAYSPVVDTATNEARHQLYLKDPQSNDFLAPVLFMRLEDGRLWKAQTIYRTAEDTSFDFDQILTWLKRRQVIPILGPGINRGLLLSRREISERWSVDVDYPVDAHSHLSAVASFKETIRGLRIPHADLFDLLKEDLLSRENIKQRQHYSDQSLPQVIGGLAINYFERDSQEPHRVLAELPIDTFVTTNWDGLMTAALSWAGRTPKSWNASWNDSGPETSEYDTMKGLPNSPLVLNLFGNDIESAVLTEDDHLDFLKSMSKDAWRFPRFLKEDLTKAMLVFLGYDFRELDFKVMFRTIVSQLRPLGGTGRDRIAVIQVRNEDNLFEQKDRDKGLQRFMEREAGKLSLKVFDGTVREFLGEVKRRWTNQNRH